MQQKSGFFQNFVMVSTFYFEGSSLQINFNFIELDHILCLSLRSLCQINYRLLLQINLLFLGHLSLHYLLKVVILVTQLYLHSP